MPDMKECCTCHVLLPVSEFNRRAKASDGLQSRCRACAREWYVNNRAERGRSTRERSQAVRTELAMKINQYLLSNPCVDCGEADVRCLDFDHRHPATKVSAVCRMVANQKPWAMILPQLTYEGRDVPSTHRWPSPATTWIANDRDAVGRRPCARPRGCAVRNP